MSTSVKIAVAQINCTVGDLVGNADKIVSFCERAREAGADLVLTPELSICGYPPEDLLVRPSFADASREALEALAESITPHLSPRFEHWFEPGHALVGNAVALLGTITAVKSTRGTRWAIASSAAGVGASRLRPSAR